MAYTVPRVEIEQEFVQTPIFSNNPLAAFIFGPNYRTFRYETAAEKADTYIGAYSASAGIAPKSWPWLVDHTTERVDVSFEADGVTWANITPYVQDAYACYFSEADPDVHIGTFTPGDNLVTAIVTENPYVQTNAFQAADLYFANGVDPRDGTAYPRSAYFAARDVQVGDWVAVTGVNYNSVSKTIFAQIIEISADETTGEVNIIRTAQRIFDIPDGSGTELIDPEAASIKIKLYLRKSMAMSRVSATTGEFLSNTTSSTQVECRSGAKITDPLLTEGGDLFEMAIGVPTVTNGVTFVPASVYVSYRVLRTDNAGSIASLNDPALVEGVLGPVNPLNPLAEGVYDALLNAAGTSVYYMAVSSDDLTGYNAVLEQAKRTSLIYGMVPLTFDSTIQTAVIAHVNTMSTSAQAKWRKVWLCKEPVTVGTVAGYDKVSVGVYWKVGSITADSQTGDTDTMLTVVGSGTAPEFVTDAIRIGDIVRIHTSTSAPSTDPADYTDYTITAVRSQDELVVDSALTSQTVAQVVQILRNYTGAEQVATLTGATVWGTDGRRINPVFPAWCGTAGVAKQGYYLAAALAGLRAGSLPHRPLTNVQVLGFDDLTDTLVTFTPTELDTLASGGYWIVTQDTVGGTAYNRHQLTAAGYDEVGDDPKFSEDSLTTNVDSVSYGLQRALSPYIGKYNVNPATLALVSAAVNRQLKYTMDYSASSASGPQLLGYNVLSLAQDSVFKDRIVGRIELDLPYPLNKVTITLVVP